MRPQVVTVTGVGNSNPIPVDYRQKPFNLSLHVEPGGNTVSVEYTPSNVLAGDSPVWFPVSGMTAVTTNTAGNIAFPIMAVRLVQSIGAGTSKLTIIQSRTA